MTRMTRRFILFGALTLLAVAPVAASATTARHSVVGAGGYDLVSYHQGQPQLGSGRYTSTQQGVTYLFSSEANKRTFLANPQKYLPAYGGWCAFGVAIGKKFVPNPTVWAIVDGKLYLNLDRQISAMWNKDRRGFIAKANAKWSMISSKRPTEL